MSAGVSLSTAFTKPQNGNGIKGAVAAWRWEWGGVAENVICSACDAWFGRQLATHAVMVVMSRKTMCSMLVRCHTLSLAVDNCPTHGATSFAHSRLDHRDSPKPR